jgi:hypothetical protein
MARGAGVAPCNRVAGAHGEERIGDVCQGRAGRGRWASNMGAFSGGHLPGAVNDRFSRSVDYMALRGTHCVTLFTVDTGQSTLVPWRNRANASMLAANFF